MADRLPNPRRPPGIWMARRNTPVGAGISASCNASGQKTLEDAPYLLLNSSRSAFAFGHQVEEENALSRTAKGSMYVSGEWFHPIKKMVSICAWLPMKPIVDHIRKNGRSGRRSRKPLSLSFLVYLPTERVAAAEFYRRGQPAGGVLRNKPLCPGLPLNHHTQLLAFVAHHRFTANRRAG